MRLKTPEQLKGAIRNIAKEKQLKPQEVLQMFLFERILERLSLSRYQDNFILKGGLLISSMIGVEGRRRKSDWWTNWDRVSAIPINTAKSIPAPHPFLPRGMCSGRLSPCSW